MYRLICIKNSAFLHKIYAYVSYDCQNKHKLFPWTELTIQSL
jgi:hypothetical protein